MKRSNVVSIHLALLIDSSRFLRMRILGSSDQKPTKNKQKRRHKSKFFEFFRTCPNTSERHPNASGQVRTGPNGSKQVRTGPNTSENMKKRSGTPKKSENFRKISRSRANFLDAALRPSRPLVPALGSALDAARTLYKITYWWKKKTNKRNAPHRTALGGRKGESQMLERLKWSDI